MTSEEGKPARRALEDLSAPEQELNAQEAGDVHGGVISSGGRTYGSGYGGSWDAPLAGGSTSSGVGGAYAEIEAHEAEIKELSDTLSQTIDSASCWLG
jgi:hypothetical protein